MVRVCAVSVDLDEICCYHAIHGLPNPERALGKVYENALPRVEEWARSVGIPLTLFVVGRDLEQPENRNKLLALHQAGFELANHTLDHRYDLTRLPLDSMRYQVLAGAERVQAITGRAPMGFRAPGYVVTDALLRVVAESGALYDSSVFPCPLYYGAKAAAIGWKRLRARPSRSLLDWPGVLGAPTRPYQIGRSYAERGDGLWEMPIQVTPWLRLPFIGTSLAALGPRAARRLTQQLLGEAVINLELHGLDFLDQTDELSDLAAHQPDLRIPLKTKLAAFSSVVAELQANSYQFVRLADAVSECVAAQGAE